MGAASRDFTDLQPEDPSPCHGRAPESGNWPKISQLVQSRAGLELGFRALEHQTCATASCPSVSPLLSQASPSSQARKLCHLHLSPCIAVSSPRPGTLIRATAWSLSHQDKDNMQHSCHSLFNNLHHSSLSPIRSNLSPCPYSLGPQAPAPPAPQPTRAWPCSLRGPSPLSWILSAPSPDSGPCDSPSLEKSSFRLAPHPVALQGSLQDLRPRRHFSTAPRVTTLLSCLGYLLTKPQMHHPTTWLHSFPLQPQPGIHSQSLPECLLRCQKVLVPLSERVSRARTSYMLPPL